MPAQATSTMRCSGRSFSNPWRGNLSASVTSCGEALSMHRAIEKAAPSVVPMILVPLPRLVFPMQELPSLPR